MVCSNVLLVVADVNEHLKEMWREETFEQLAVAFHAEEETQRPKGIGLKHRTVTGINKCYIVQIYLQYGLAHMCVCLSVRTIHM